VDLSHIYSFEIPIILIGIILVYCLPRRSAILWFAAISILIPYNHRILVWDIELPVVRILVLVAIVRFCLRSEKAQVSWNSIDKAVVAFGLFATVAYTLLWGTSASFINRVGWVLIDNIGVYVVGRFMIRDLEDVTRLVKTAAIVSIILFLPMLYEKLTSRNMFLVYASEFVGSRDGHIRAKGPFGHPILAGSFTSSLIPLFYGFLWKSRQSRKLAAIAMIAATSITVCTASSGPVLTYAVALIAYVFWSFRSQMRLVRWGAAFALIGLHVVMNDPVWALPYRFKVFSASTGRHRFRVLDQFLRRWDEWWFVGVQSTESCYLPCIC